jgi:predicted RND superfamily exporter protein
MFHNYSAGVFGKGGEMYDQLQFERAWSEKFMSEVYKDFLTTEEINAMLNNKDIWMTSEQVLERIESIMKKLQEQENVKNI